VQILPLYFSTAWISTYEMDVPHCNISSLFQINVITFPSEWSYCNKSYMVNCVLFCNTSIKKWTYFSRSLIRWRIRESLLKTLWWGGQREVGACKLVRLACTQNSKSPFRFKVWLKMLILKKGQGASFIPPTALLPDESQKNDMVSIVALQASIHGSAFWI